ncbi:uncharacterized protein LOC130625998 [Hydractinia symbiolongicarpus]|uniref:uncharacterized protein LOC130625998 n=1 Tax=Hydractinia symbiolongicarpus TaxID=13093 RepID=UPI0025505BAF|nr:uncharacterized protein LOC130625998 [Hydractinia symbiolongicarpus]
METLYPVDWDDTMTLPVFSENEEIDLEISGKRKGKEVIGPAHLKIAKKDQSSDDDLENDVEEHYTDMDGATSSRFLTPYERHHLLDTAPDFYRITNISLSGK